MASDYLEFCFLDTDHLEFDWKIDKVRPIIISLNNW
jgi:hypothetical protein